MLAQKKGAIPGQAASILQKFAMTETAAQQTCATLPTVVISPILHAMMATNAPLIVVTLSLDASLPTKTVMTKTPAQ